MLAVLASLALAQQEIGPFRDQHETFLTQASGVFLNRVSVFGGNAELVDLGGLSGVHVTSGWSFQCTANNLGGGMLAGNASDGTYIEFHVPTYKFGGMFTSNSPYATGVTLNAYDSSGALLFSLFKLYPGCGSYIWAGIESPVPMARVEILNDQWNGAFVQMDELEMSSDICEGDDTLGDSDGDGICDDLDECEGDDASGDTDGDGICDDLDECVGDDTAGDTDGDGICDDLDECVGDDASGDTDGDGICDDLDVCEGDDASGDTDGDGICDDLDDCNGDADEDGDCVETDCDDADPEVSSLAIEVCNGIDDNCDGAVDEIGCDTDDPTPDSDYHLSYKACGCVSNGSPGGVLAILAAVALVVRRRARSR